jgi:phospholipid/cholesterol/gamma-HCH transport system ATP-binding protein
MRSTILDHRFILRLEDVKLFADRQKDGEVVRAHFEIYGGELALLRLENEAQAEAFADVCAGLRPPLKGRIFFLGRDWRRTRPDTANAMRGRIGRVFSTPGWMHGRSVAETVLLPGRHHTRRSARHLRQEAGRLARRFGLPGLPLDLPENCSRDDLLRAGLVRAFLGDPVLLLLENPTFGVFPAILPALINVVRRARNSGAAVLWMTLSEKVWRDLSGPADRRFRLTGHEFREVARG